MSLPFDFYPTVRAEIDNAYSWYEGRRAGLGVDFLDEVERVLAQIAANPARYGFAEADIREAPFRRFPYAIYYRVLPDRIRVLAVYHSSKDPAGWQSRV